MYLLLYRKCGTALHACMYVCILLAQVQSSAGPVDRIKLVAESAMLQRVGSRAVQRTAAEHSPRIAAEHSPNDINHSFQSDSVPDDASSELQREGVWREPSPDPATEQDLSNLQYENAPASSSNSSEKLQKKGTKIPRRYS